MPPAFLGTGRIQAVTLGNFFSLGSAPSSVNYATESWIARPLRVPGKFARLSVSFDNQGTSRAVRFRKNSANGNLVVNPADSTAETKTDTTNTDILVAGDTWDFTPTGTAPAFGINALGVIFIATYGHACHYLTTASTFSANPIYITMLAATVSATEANVQSKVRTAGTIKGGTASISTGTSGATTITSRINGVSGTVAISVTSGTTGLFEDNTHTDTFVSGDLLGWIISGATSGSGQIGTTFQFSSPKNEVPSFYNGINFNASTQYIPIVGGAVTITTTEGNTQIAQGFKFKATNMRTYVATNTLASAMTVQLRKNGGNANQSLSLTAAGTGWFEDSSNTDLFNQNDTLNYSFSGGTSGSIGGHALIITQIPATDSSNIPMLGM